MTCRLDAVQFSCSVMSNSLWPRGLQRAKLPCITNPWDYSNSCPLSRRCHPTISSSVIPFSSCLQSFPASGLLQWVSSLHHVAKVLEFQLQHQSDFIYDWLVGSPCSPRDSQESSPTSQFKSISSSVLSFLYNPALTSIHDYWKYKSWSGWWGSGGIPPLLVVENPPASSGNVKDTGLIPGSGKIPWRRAWQPTPVFLPGESYWQRSLADYSP